MRLLDLVSIPLLVLLAACGGKSGGAAAPRGPVPAAVTHPNVAGTYDLELSSARSTQPIRQSLQILAGDKPGSYAASLTTSRGIVQYPTGHWQGQDLILSGADESGNTRQLRLRFEGERFTGSWSMEGRNRVSGVLKGQKR